MDSEASGREARSRLHAQPNKDRCCLPQPQLQVLGGAVVRWPPWDPTVLVWGRKAPRDWARVTQASRHEEQRELTTILWRENCRLGRRVWATTDVICYAEA